MRRDIVVRKLCEFAKPNDIVLLGSNGISKEVSDLYKPGHFYIEDTYGMALPVAIGIAMGTDKRVFLLIGEGDILRNFSALNQMAFSKKQNLFVFILNNGCYQAAGGFPNIFNNITSIQPVIFSIGCRIFGLSTDFEKKRYNSIQHFIDRGQGPMVCIIKVDSSKVFNTEPKNNLEEFLTFVRDKSIKTALYNPFAEGFISAKTDEGRVPILDMQE